MVQDDEIDQEPADPYADWQTYTNEEYGFEFKYPQTYSFQEDWVQSTATETEGELPYASVAFSSSNDQGQPFLVNFTPIFLSDITLAEYVDSSRERGPGDVVASDQVFNKYPNTAELNAFISEWYGGVYVFIESGNNLIDFTTSVSNKNLLDQILATFKFIDQADTSTWQTYRNEEFGFEFRYPANWSNENREEMLKVGPNTLDSYNFPMSIYVYPLELLRDGPTLEGLAQTQMEDLNSSKRSEVKIDGLNAVRVEGTFVDNYTGSGKEYLHAVTFIEKQRIYQISYNFENSSYLDFYDLILSSFKFTQ